MHVLWTLVAVAFGAFLVWFFTPVTTVRYQAVRTEVISAPKVCPKGLQLSRFDVLPNGDDVYIWRGRFTGVPKARLGKQDYLCLNDDGGLRRCRCG